MKKIKGRKAYNPQTYGFDINGTYHVFKINRALGTGFYIQKMHLTKLTIHDEVNDVFCGNNHLKFITFNKPVTRLICNDNQLIHLKPPEGLKTLYCENNNLTKLELPKSVTYLKCDKELFDYDTCEINNVNISYG